MSKRALISVTDKSGVVEFARELNNLGYEVISTGNTFKILKENGVNAITIDEVTKFPEMLDGRVKTLNPYIHGGILYKRDEKSHVDTVNEYNIGSIDLVVVNLYDFEGTLKAGKSHEGIWPDAHRENLYGYRCLYRWLYRLYAAKWRGKGLFGGRRTRTARLEAAQ